MIFFPLLSFLYMQAWLSDNVFLIAIGGFLLPEIIILILAVIIDSEKLQIDVIRVNDVSS